MFSSLQLVSVAAGQREVGGLASQLSRDEREQRRVLVVGMRADDDQARVVRQLLEKRVEGRQAARRWGADLRPGGSGECPQCGRYLMVRT